MIIKNWNALATNELRKKALDIIEAGITSVLPPNIIKAAVKYSATSKTLFINSDTYSTSGGRIFVIGGGKASSLMAEALEAIIQPENITAGVVNCRGSHYNTSKIEVITAGHPIPDGRGIDGVSEMLDLKRRYSINERDFILCLISGGGSALMPYPVYEVSLEAKQEITRLLLDSGAEIGEINIVRKHLSQVKGGQLGRYYLPATVISLILSDVIGNDLSVIASGPTYPDSSTFSGACEVLERYHLLSRAPKSVIDFLRKGCLGEVVETPKALDNCQNYIIGDNSLALEAMQSRAKQMRLAPCIVTGQQQGDVNAVAVARAEELLNMKYAEYNAILIGGETTMTLPSSSGRGGRNQHYAAVSMLAMEKYQSEWVVASVGTDGSDFLPDVAGAMVDQNSLDIARNKGIDVKSYIETCDSNTLLGQIGNSLIITGDTGTNVGDIIVYLTT